MMMDPYGPNKFMWQSFGGVPDGDFIDYNQRFMNKPDKFAPLTWNGPDRYGGGGGMQAERTLHDAGMPLAPANADKWDDKEASWNQINVDSPDLPKGLKGEISIKWSVQPVQSFKHPRHLGRVARSLRRRQRSVGNAFHLPTSSGNPLCLVESTVFQ